MSNYLTVIVKETKLNKLKEWLQRHEADEMETAYTEISKNTYLFYISRGASDDFCEKLRFIFKGFGVNYQNSEVIFGGNGKRLLLNNDNLTSSAKFATRSLEGCYLSIEWDEEEALVSNDTFGMLPINYFCENDITAVSDSIFILTELRKHLNLPCTLHEESAIARAWTNTMAGQLLSEDTLIAQIKFVQAASHLIIRTNEPYLSTKITSGDLTQFTATTRENYKNTVRTAVIRCASLIQTLSGISTDSVRLALSGGIDSRVVLACALASPTSREMAVFNCTNSSPAQQKDYQVVALLSEQFGFPLGSRVTNPKRKSPTKIRNPLNLWFLGNAGLYDFLVAPGHYSPNARVFSFGGFGAEIYKGMYGWRSIKDISNHITDSPIADAFTAQCTKGLEKLGIDANDNTGSEWHYLAFRNAIHSGRSALTTMTGMRPIMQKELVGLVRSKSNPFPTPKTGDKSIMTDLLICADPALAKMPFDNDKKNMDLKYVNERSYQLGGPLDYKELETYRLYGDFAAIKNYTPTLFRNIAKQSNWNGLSMSKDNLVSLMQDGFDKITTEQVRNAYKPVFNAGMMKLLEGGRGNPSNLRSSPGKLMSFLLLD